MTTQKRSVNNPFSFLLYKRHKLALAAERKKHSSDKGSRKKFYCSSLIVYKKQKEQADKKEVPVELILHRRKFSGPVSRFCLDGQVLVPQYVGDERAIP